MDESVSNYLHEQELTGEALKYHLLAEAIRAGARIRKKCVGRTFARGGSCAIGAAFEATFHHTQICQPSAVLALRDSGIWPEKLKSEPVWQANDWIGMTREAIADRLDDVAYGRIAEF